MLSLKYAGAETVILPKGQCGQYGCMTLERRICEILSSERHDGTSEEGKRLMDGGGRMKEEKIDTKKSACP